MPGYIIARHSSILSNPGLCQATSSRGTASFSAKPAYAKLHHREAQQHPQQPRPMPGYIIARRSFFLSNPSLCQATLGPVVLPRVPLLVGVDQGEELTHSLLGRLPTTHLLQTLAIHGSQGAPWISALASRKAKARACCQGHRRPSGAESHASRRAMLGSEKQEWGEQSGCLGCWNARKYRCATR